MTKNIYVFLFIAGFISCLSVLTKGTYSAFSDSATAGNNTFSITSFASSSPATNPLTESITPTPTSSPTPTTPATPTAGPTNMATHIVISEVQIKGANANQDFVELYNPTNANIDLAGWQLKIKNSAGNSSSLVVIDSGTISAHGFFLWANNQGGYNILVGADITNGNNIYENSSLLLEDQFDNYIDALGWGNSTNPYIEANTFEDNANSNQSIERKAYSSSTATSMETGVDQTKGNGYDSNNNAADFVLRTLSQPQNTSSATETP